MWFLNEAITPTRQQAIQVLLHRRLDAALVGAEQEAELELAFKAFGADAQAAAHAGALHVPFG